MSVEKVRYISSADGSVWADIKEMAEYKDLLVFLIWRDIMVRYKQTFLGTSWAVIQPVIYMVVFSLFFGGLAKMPSDGIPYPIFSYAALLPWLYFSNSFTFAANSFVANAAILTKVHIPRILIVFGAVFPRMLDFIISFIILVFMMFYYKLGVSYSLLYLPLFFFLAVLFTFGLGLWMAVLNVRYRDIGILIPFLVQLGMYISPVVYSSSLVPEQWRLLFFLNPMTCVIEGFRWSLLGTMVPSMVSILLSLGVCITLLIIALYSYYKLKNTFADVI